MSKIDNLWFELEKRIATEEISINAIPLCIIEINNKYRIVYNEMIVVSAIEEIQVAAAQHIEKLVEAWLEKHNDKTKLVKEAEEILKTMIERVDEHEREHGKR